jgi:lipoyl-dependent peroxiredoxin
MATIKRTASAVWSGTGKEGKGAITTQSGVLSDTPYGFSRRFGDEKGTNPEELIAAAHAGCFTMALTFILGEAGHVPDRIRTLAKVHLGVTTAGPTLTRIELETEGSVPGLDEEKFRALAETAKKTCLVSRALAGVPDIRLTATLTDPVLQGE